MQPLTHQRLTSRIAPVIVAVLVLAACGADDASVSAPPADTDDGATPTSMAPTDGAEMREPEPIEVVGSGGPGGARATATSESSAATSDMMIAPVPVDYEVAGDLALPADDTGWVFDSTGTTEADEVAALAAAFGVEGEPTRVEDAFTSAWVVGSDDGSAPALRVTDDSQANWNYSAAWANEVATECVIAVDGQGEESYDCDEPQPPAGVPTAEDAEQRATELLMAIGVDPASLRLETFADEWSAFVTASDTADGRAPLRTWSFGFGGDGVLQHAAGSLASPEPVGPFPLVDLDTAVARLSEGYFGGFFGGVATPDIAVASEPLAEDAGGIEEDDTAEGTAGDIEPLPVEPPPGEPMVVALTGVEADLWWAWDRDGTVWLLPAYRFTSDDGGWHVVPAVTDEFLIRAEPDPDDAPIPVEPDEGIGDGAEPLPVEEPPTEVTDPPVDVRPVDDPEGALPALEEFVGLSIEEFTAEARTLGFDTRIVELDGEPLAGTADYRTDRVNVVVEGPRVVSIASIG